MGNFLCDQHEYCFVVEDHDGVCGYVLATLDAREHLMRRATSWMPAMCEKYPKPEATEGLSPSEVSMDARARKSTRGHITNLFSI